MGCVGCKRCNHCLRKLIILLAVLPSGTQAQITITQPIRFAFSGTVTGYSGAYSLVSDAIAVSDTFSGYYDFNPDIPATPPSTPS
jgi:hypothetical protein